MVPCLQSRWSVRWLVISSALAITACAEDPGLKLDVPPDDRPGFTGLTLDFVADTPLPAQLGADLRIDDIYLNGAVIRAVGDATTQDEQPTTRHDHALHWAAGAEPADLTFAAAPAGEYSYVELRIAGQPEATRTEAFAVRGQVRGGHYGDWTDFVIRADAPVVVAAVPAAVQLEAGRPLMIKLELVVSRLVAGIVWDDLPMQDGGKLVLDERTPDELASFCAALGGAFAAH